MKRMTYFLFPLIAMSLYACKQETDVSDSQLESSAMVPYVHEDINKGSKKTLIVGDSITVSNCNTQSSSGARDNKCGWRKYFGELCNSNSSFSYDTLSKIGIAVSTVSKSFPQSYGNIETPFVSASKQYDAVFVHLGVNDIGMALADVPQSKYVSLIEKVIALKPKQIYLISLLPSCYYSGSKKNMSKKIMAANANIPKWFPHDKYPNIHFLNIYPQFADSKECLASQYNSGDGLHPKSTGDAGAQTQKHFAESIVGEIKAMSNNELCSQ